MVEVVVVSLEVVEGLFHDVVVDDVVVCA